MKKYFVLSLLAIASMAKADPTPVPSQILTGFYVSSISANGKWIVGQTDAYDGITIVNLWNNQRWTYENRRGSGTGYAPANGRCVSDDGIVIAEVFDVPQYWNGEWHVLPGGVQEGQVAILGSITPDGSAIVGSISQTSLSLEDRQMDSPCVWYRKDDGTYGNPVFLPSVGKDLFGNTPQYVHALAVSDDGNTIAGTMRSGNGFFTTPLIYRRDASGTWSGAQIGLDLINPTGRPIPSPVGDYNGPNPPDYEEYLQEEGILLADIENDYYQWYDQQLELGVSEDVIPWLAISEFYPRYMTGENKVEYMLYATEFIEAYLPWMEKFNDYSQFIDQLESQGVNFLFNNAYISPDGKKAFYTTQKTSTGTSDDPEFQGVTLYSPVMYNVEEGTFETFNTDKSLILTSVAADYSVFGQGANIDDKSMYRDGYVFPKAQFESVSVPVYIQDLGQTAALDWIEDNMYREVVVSVTASGQEVLGERYTIGLPVCTPDQSLIAFANSTTYWGVQPEYELVTFLLNTGLDAAAVETVVDEGSSVYLSVLPGGVIRTSGPVKAIEIYDLSGKTLFSTSTSGGDVATGLSNGLYIVKCIGQDGAVTAKKIIF